MSWDDDDKTRRNLVVASGLVLAHAYLGLPGSKLLSAITSAPLDPLRLSGLTLLVLGYLFARFALSADGRDLADRVRLQCRNIYRAPLVQELDGAARDWPNNAETWAKDCRLVTSSGMAPGPAELLRFSLHRLEENRVETPLSRPAVPFSIQATYRAPALIKQPGIAKPPAPPPESTVVLHGEIPLPRNRWFRMLVRAWLRAALLTGEGFNLLAPVALWIAAWAITAWQFFGHLCRQCFALELG